MLEIYKMKKALTLLLFLVITKINAQEIGIRFGNFKNKGIAIDGIVSFEDATRLHGDITFANDIGANLLYDFKVNHIDLGNLKLQYYIGTGIHSYLSDDFTLGINGETGIEYLFKQTPITVGLDWRPQLDIITNTSLDIFKFGLNIRYRINEL